MIRLNGFLAILLLTTCMSNAQQDTSHKATKSIFSDPSLQSYRTKANDHFLSFKNRYALETLKDMDAAADTLAAANLQREDNELRRKRDMETLDQTIKIAEQDSTIKSFEEQNEVLRTERNKLWSKAIISTVVWLILVALFVVYRLRMYGRTNKILLDSHSALAVTEKFHQKGEQLIRAARESEALLDKTLKAGSASADSPVAAVESIAGVAAINDLILLLSKEAAEENPAVSSVDVNSLCEQLAALGSSGIETEEGVYHFTITKDLEKKLPAVMTNEQGLARVLLFLISNALNACYRQSKSGMKGYQPKVVVSTRVLPRFVQVKVKDNGAGVTDEILEQIYTPYFTTVPDKKAGLGLSLCKKIITESKGELKIESALDRGTDVTVKLFLQGK